MLQHSDACERNKEPILEVLRGAFRDVTTVLEIGSGTGQHAVYFAAQLPHLVWQPSDLAENLPAVRARLELEGATNIKPPLALDAGRLPWPVDTVEAVFTANTLHIVSWEQVCGLFRGAGEVVSAGGRLCVYGPFAYGGKHTSTSNEQFDAMLRRRDPLSGIRSFEAVDALAGEYGFTLDDDVAMPANNRTLVWSKQLK